MSLSLYLEKSLDAMETYRLAEVTDLMYRRLHNKGFSRKHVDAILPDNHTALELAAAKIIKITPYPMHPVRFVNERNLAVVKAVTMSRERAVILGAGGRIYSAYRGRKLTNKNFEPTALNLTTNFMLVGSKVIGGRRIKRLAILKPTVSYMN